MRNRQVKRACQRIFLAFDLLQYAVTKATRDSEAANKTITFVVCTNLALISDEILDFFHEHNILVSTSLDGPKHVHDSNRHKPHASSYDLTVAGIKKVRDALGFDRVSALMTTTSYSLDYPIEIVNEYASHGFSSIFLRSMSPYGFALRTERLRYTSEQFLAFYKTAFQHILSLNKQGIHFVEDFACILLTKLLTPFTVGFVDMQSPAGLINSVVVYNYDGKVYASDESRMLAEAGDDSFLIGHVSDNYYSLFFGEKANEIAQISANECLAGCSDCGFQSICGADPVHNWATQNDMYGYRPDSDFCAKNMEIIRYLLDLYDSDDEVRKIFLSWISPR